VPGPWSNGGAKRRRLRRESPARSTGGSYDRATERHCAPSFALSDLLGGLAVVATARRELAKLR
jgi:hypothetical protein